MSDPEVSPARPRAPWFVRLNRALGLSLKDWITITISILAFSVSGLTAYFNMLRISDDLSLVAATIPELIVAPSGQLEFESPDISAVFINSGSRPVAIYSLYIQVSQLRPDSIDTGE